MEKLLRIKLENLSLDLENPRLPPNPDGSRWTQQSTLRYFADDKRTRQLAKSIAERGQLNPSKRLIVLEDKRAYIVLEGNRRVAALRLLHKPALAPSASLVKAFQSLANSADDIPDQVSCIVVKSRQEAAPWISIEHASGEDGATVKWETWEKERFADLMSNGKARHKRSMELATLLFSSGQIDAGTYKQIPLTSLDRLLTDPYVREQLGADNFNEDLPDLGRRAAVRIVKELANKATKVGEIMSKEDRKSYIDRVMREPDVISEPSEKTKADKKPVQSKKSDGTAKKNQPNTWERNKLVPASFKARISTAKLRAVYNDLRHIPVKDHACTVAVMFRVFLEFVLTDYLANNDLPQGQSKENLAEVLKHLIANGKVTDSEIKPVKIALNDRHHYLSVQAMHAYVHEKFVIPDWRQLNKTWDAFQPLFSAVLH